MMALLTQLDTIVTMATQLLLVLIVVPLGTTLVRMTYGPSRADRFVALDMLTGIAVATAALTMASTGRREYLDVGLGLAIFGFMGTCALAIFLEHKKSD